MAGRSATLPAGAARASAGVSAEVRLGLTEFLLACEDTGECAQRTLEWLAEYAGVEAGVVLAVNVENARLAMVAHHGAALRDDEYSVDLDDRAQPLVAAAFGDQPVPFEPGRARSLGTPLGPRAFVAVPMLAARGREKIPAGLLLIAPPSADAATARWAG